MKLVKTLYKKAKKGKPLVWSVYTNGAEIITEYGELEGKQQRSVKVAKGKNIGRSNETTDEEQALLEAKSLAEKKQLAGKYYESLDDAQNEDPLMPMLADKYNPKKEITFPVTVQPKLDGLRCLARWDEGADTVVLQSRGNKTYSIPIIEYALTAPRIKEKLKEGLILDGEIYTPHLTFQEICSAAKKTKKSSALLEFHVYDMVEDSGWLIRKLKLQDLKPLIAGTCVKLVENDVANSHEEIKQITSKFVAAGYEGGIVRLHDSRGYEVGHRSSGLLKVKTFSDKEFRITGYCSGVGKAKDCVIYECCTEDGKEFKVVPKGTLEERKTMLDKAHKHIGKYLKVKYFEMTDEGIPRFPVGLGIRLEEDM